MHSGHLSVSILIEHEADVTKAHFMGMENSWLLFSFFRNVLQYQVLGRLILQLVVSADSPSCLTTFYFLVCFVIFVCELIISRDLCAWVW